MAIIEKTEKTSQPGIYKITYPSGKVSYRAHVFHPGKKPIAKIFRTFKLAERWKRLNKDSFEASGLPLTNRLLEKTKVIEIVERYIEGSINVNGKPLSKGTIGDIKRFGQWLKDNGNPSLHAFNEQIAETYKNELLNGTWLGKGWKGKPRNVSPPSVRKHISVIQPIWKMARIKWGFANLDNPFRFIVIIGSDVVSTRRLKPGELNKLITTARKWPFNYTPRGIIDPHNYYIPLALMIAVETGMRREEIFSLTWQDVDMQNRRIRVEKTKTGIPRLIVMPWKTTFCLMQLYILLSKAESEGVENAHETFNGLFYDTTYKIDFYPFKETDRILYPRSKATAKYTAIERAIENFEDALWDVRQRASLYDPDPETRKDRWNFRCLRKEAAAQLRKAKLRFEQINRMMGHVDKRKDMTDRYWDLDDADLREIQDALDRRDIGETQAEAEAWVKANPFLSEEEKEKLRPIVERFERGEFQIPHPIRHSTQYEHEHAKRMDAMAKALGKALAGTL